MCINLLMRSFHYTGFLSFICAMVKSRVLLGMVIPPFNGNPYNGYINPYYWVDDHPLTNNGSLDPIAHMVSIFFRHMWW